MDKCPTPPLLGPVEQSRQSIITDNTINENDLITGKVSLHSLEASYSNCDKTKTFQKDNNPNVKKEKNQKRKIETSTEDDEDDPFKYIQKIKQKKTTRINVKKTKAAVKQPETKNKSNKSKLKKYFLTSSSNEDDDEPSDQIKPSKRTRAITTITKNTKKPNTRANKREKK